MEPTIYKPGVYKSPGIYKGSGVYKGEDGDNEWIFLNNFNKLENDAQDIISSAGENLHSVQTLAGEISSSYYNSEYAVKFLKSLYGSSCNYRTQNVLSKENVVTIEMAFSDYVSGQNVTYLEACRIQLEIDSFPDKIVRMDIEQWGKGQWDSSSYQLFGNATVRAANIYRMEPDHSPVINGFCHLAIVLDLNENKLYAFFNGVKKVIANILKPEGDYANPPADFGLVNVGQEQSNYVNFKGEFISIRRGDFSNNRESFDIPTQKYQI